MARVGRLLAVAALFLAALAMPGQAIGNCDVYQTIKVSGLLSVTDVQVCGTPAQGEYGEIGDVALLNARVSIPNIASTPTITITAGTPVGCTAGTATTRSVSGTNGGSNSYLVPLSTTDTSCAMSLRIQVTVAATIVFDNDFAWDFHCKCLEHTTIDAWPALSGTVNTPLSGTITANGAQTLSGTVNTPLSGTITANGAQTLSGTITANGAQTLSGGVTVTDDANGWAIHQDQACGATVHCLQDVDLTDDTTADGKVTVPVADAGDVMVNGTSVFVPEDVTNHVDLGGFDGLQFDGSLLMLAWLLAMVWCMRLAKLFGAIAAFIGILFTMLPGPDFIALAGVLIFALVMWFEAVARDKLPYHWFKGDSKTESGA